MARAECAFSSSRVDATPRVEPGKPALRCGLGRYTVDFLPDVDENGINVIVSNGELGTGPVTGRVSPEIVAATIFAAGFVRSVGVQQTPAWTFG